MMLSDVVTNLLPKLRRSEALPLQSSFCGATDVMEVPVFEFGMLGFSAGQREQIASLIKSLPATTATWRSCNFPDADAWLVCGEKTRPEPGPSASNSDSVKILAGIPSEHSTVLNLAQINRPTAFSRPLHSADIEPRFTFDPASAQGIQSLLHQFEACMSPLRSQIVLGKQLIEHEANLISAVYHVIHNGHLLAVMDFVNWKIGFSPDANPHHLEHAIWEKRPTQAHVIPTGFVHTDAAKLRWMYARHSTRDVLPARYRDDLIYFRQAPTVPVAWLTDSHLLLIRELSMRPANFQQLVERTGIPYAQLTRDLACLYFAACLTTMASKAANAADKQVHVKQNSTASSAKNQGGIFNSSLHLDPNPAPETDQTVPARLGNR